ncbi:hypothetical protein BDF19DRAFT_421378 [Syncephalis fuscata]|nr:hypothetical protein BDF19DRAFT_421378 [Syncephalis fuscata]
MPAIDYNSHQYAEWINSNMKQLGIPLHPLGEIHVFDFFMEASGDIYKQRLRLLGAQAQIVMIVIASFIFGRNLAVASKMFDEYIYIHESPW